MIFGIGTDIIEIARIQKAILASERFAARILTAQEMDFYAQSRQQAHFLAKRFAAKEALVKAMGTGIGNGIGWQMMQIKHNNQGKPLLEVFDTVSLFFSENKITSCHVSISDETHYAMATVVLER